MKFQNRILYCGPEDSLFKKLARCARDLSWQARGISFSTSPQKIAQRYKASVLVLKVKNDFELMHQEWLSKSTSSTPVIIVSQTGGMGTAIQAMQYGAFDYFRIEQPAEMIVLKVREALRRTFAAPKRHLEFRNQILLGNHPAITKINEQAENLAKDKNPIFISGEAGTGKEHLAYGLYRLAGHKTAPFIRFDSRTLLEMSKYDGQPVPQLIQSSLKSLKKSANVYLFLSHVEYLASDHMTEILEKRAPSVKLLFSYQDSPHSLFAHKIKERLPAIELPPLRQRKDDIPLIAEFFMRKTANKKKIRAQLLGEETLLLMQNYPWPGNIQELANVIERMSSLEPSRVLTPTSWHLAQGFNFSMNPDGANQFLRLLDQLLHSTEQHWKDGALYEDFMAKMEKMLINLVLPQVGFNQATAAKILGISRNTLSERLRGV